MKNTGDQKTTKVNINIFLSQDILDDVASDGECAVGGMTNLLGPSKCREFVKSSINDLASSSSSSTTASNSALNLSSTRSPEESTTVVNSATKLSASARRAQFQKSRRIMSAPIRPINLDDMKAKKKAARKKKVIRVNLTLNRDDESDDVNIDEIQYRKPAHDHSKTAARKAAFAVRSRSVLGCDQMGIETMVSILNSSEESDMDEKDDLMPIPLPPQRVDSNIRLKNNVLRKTVSFQDDDSKFIRRDSLESQKTSNIAFSGRMRHTRSLFGQEICNLYLPNRDRDKSIERKNDNSTAGTGKIDGEIEVTKQHMKVKKEQKENSSGGGGGGGGGGGVKSQMENQSPKEQECWRLYEKMKKTGLNVSYDTILRGILKPSELRLLEKQKKNVEIETELSEIREIDETESRDVQAVQK